MLGHCILRVILKMLLRKYQENSPSQGDHTPQCTPKDHGPLDRYCVNVCVLIHGMETELVVTRLNSKLVVATMKIQHGSFHRVFICIFSMEPV